MRTKMELDVWETRVAIQPTKALAGEPPRSRKPLSPIWGTAGSNPTPSVRQWHGSQGPPRVVVRELDMGIQRFRHVRLRQHAASQPRD
jgi:hypothetical protein